MRYFLDTNICIYALKNKYPRIKKMMEILSPLDIAIPSIVKAELYYGVQKSQWSEKTRSILDRFLSPFEIVPFSDSEVSVYGEIRVILEKEGKAIGPNDLIIAATVLSHGAILVTHNTKEFSRIENLKIEDWTLEN